MGFVVRDYVATDLTPCDQGRGRRASDDPGLPVGARTIAGLRTNFVHAIDSAVLRPGRFDLPIPMSPAMSDDFRRDVEQYERV